MKSTFEHITDSIEYIFFGIILILLSPFILLYLIFVGFVHILCALGEGILSIILPKKLYEKLILKLEPPEVESGCGFTVFSAVFMGIVIVAIVIFIIFFPQIEALLIALVGLVGAGLAWSIRKALSTMQARARLIILEALSHGSSLTREEIKKLVNNYSIMFRLSGSIYSVALNSLLKEDKIKIDKGLFYLESK